MADWRAMSPPQFAISEEKIQAILFGEPGMEVRTEALTGQLLQAEITEHRGAAPSEQTKKRPEFARWVPAGTGVVTNPSVELSVKHALDKDAAGRFEPFSQFDGSLGPPFGTASKKAYTTVDVKARGAMCNSACRRRSDLRS